MQACRSISHQLLQRTRSAGLPPWYHTVPSYETLTTCMLLCSTWDNGNEASLAFFILIQVLGCYIVVSVLPWQHSAICIIVQ